MPLIDNKICSCCRRLYTYYVAVITNWPWKIAAYVSGLSSVSESGYGETALQDKIPNGKKSTCLRLLQAVYGATIGILVPIGLLAQDIICFRRDRLDKTYLRNNASKFECHDPSQLLSAIIILDMIVVWLLLLVIWTRVYCFLKCLLCCFLCPCFLYYLRGMFRPDTCFLDQKNSGDKNDLSDLVNEIKEKKPSDMCMFIPMIPFIYLIFSLAVSIFNLLAFEIVNAVMDWETNISGSLRITFIVLSFIGFVAFDLLYTEVIIKYSLQCQMNITFLEAIIDKVEAKVEAKGYTNQDEAFKDVKNAQKFLKQLNENSFAIGLVLLITGLHTANSTISLLSIDHENSTYGQVIGLVLRAIHWTFLTVFPIFQAAEISNTSKKLRETGLSMYTPPPIKLNGLDAEEKKMVRKHTPVITLDAELFGFTVNPWFPYVIMILIFFALMVEPLGLEWFDRLIS